MREEGWQEAGINHCGESTGGTAWKQAYHFLPRPLFLFLSAEEERKFLPLVASFPSSYTHTPSFAIRIKISLYVLHISTMLIIPQD